MSKTDAENSFEWIDTPPARSPTTPAFDCGVKTTKVRHIQHSDNNPASH